MMSSMWYLQFHFGRLVKELHADRKTGGRKQIKAEYQAQ